MRPLISTTKKGKQMLLEERYKQAQNEIRADIKAGIVPLTVKSFFELDDYVDANTYGGLCVDGFSETFKNKDEWFEFCYLVQDALDAWIKAGRK